MSELYPNFKPVILSSTINRRDCWSRDLSLFLTLEGAVFPELYE